MLPAHRRRWDVVDSGEGGSPGIAALFVSGEVEVRRPGPGRLTGRRIAGAVEIGAQGVVGETRPPHPRRQFDGARRRMLRTRSLGDPIDRD